MAQPPFVKVDNSLISDREDYDINEAEHRVRKVLKEFEEDGSLRYLVKFEDGHHETILFETLQSLKHGQDELSTFFEVGEQSETSTASGAASGTTLQTSKTATASDISASEDELSMDLPTKLRRGRSSRASFANDRRTGMRNRRVASSQSTDDASGSRTRTNALRTSRRLQSANKTEVFSLGNTDSSSEEDSDSEAYLGSRDRRSGMKRKRKSLIRTRPYHGNDDSTSRQTKLRKITGSRHSQRTTRHQMNMKEVGEGDIYRSDSDSSSPRVPKAVGAKEVFQAIPRWEPFATRHCQQCETCGNYGGGAQGPLVLCQGCCLAYHKGCLGHRGSRDHLVTKVDHDNFLLQCRRCISLQRRKEPTAPDQGMCQVCREIGPACHPLRERKTALQEQREREENEGQDPIVSVNDSLQNNPWNVLFRCVQCWRAFHYHHLPPKEGPVTFSGQDDEALAEARLQEYSRDWTCRECANMPAKISGLIAWRPADPESYLPGQTTEQIMEDNKEYLIKWENKSYFRAQWRSGAWTWGQTTPMMRKAFAKRHDGHNLPTLTTEDAIPEEYLRIDVVLDVKYTSFVDTRAEEVDKARIREVDQALLKFKGLGYEDAVWEKVPGPEDGDRWTDFVAAYDDWVAGRYVRIPRQHILKNRLDKARATDFTSLEKMKQPSTLTGGELMKYQLEGLNWLYYRWYLKKNGILADEMGLGKTIQVIALLASLVGDHGCFPFLIVVPNSTCPNWRREIKRWAPSLRVVTYYGSAAARSLAYRYELYPDGSKDLRCHVVVTSYETAADDSCRRFFRGVSWQGLVVDEGHRLKNDRNLLYGTLSALKCPFKILLTGTPLQNNARELFNLLAFLDDSFDAQSLELEYETLTKENVPVLHNLIRPFFLRRTKAQVLTFLPPMGQVIVPVSMSVVQRKLYMSILAKNPELVKAIFDSSKRGVKQSERANLSNILMQLRKCLCHPFVYSKEIEERSVTAAVSHRNLVEASAKLQLLEILLPKLKERGHRVLIFSQFLDMLDIVEDFMDGLELRYQRLDGSITALQKQKRIDEFNAADSPLFAFLLSTRAGGVGINLATADTVIIMDPDFNPHQDIQALSRAHRIGQKNKVLCFQLMTRSSAEEKIVQIGRRKMALDHVLIERMDAEDDAGVDVESILRHGVADIMDDKVSDIKYDDASVEKLLDRTQIEDTKAGTDDTAESQFSFARVWANDAASMMDSLDGSDEEDEQGPDPGTWEKILRERERLAAEQAASRQQNLGRGKRARQAVNYGAALADETPRKGKSQDEASSDTDFQAADRSDGEEGSEGEEVDDAAEASQELRNIQAEKRASQHSAREPVRRTFRRSNVVWNVEHGGSGRQAVALQCLACGTYHEQGWCPLKLAGPEHCNLCGLAHFGVSRTCPHIRSETQVREMLAALKQSTEPRALIEVATKYLQGVKGHLVQDKRRRAEKQAEMLAAYQQQQQQQHHHHHPHPQVHLQQHWQQGHQGHQHPGANQQHQQQQQHQYHHQFLQQQAHVTSVPQAQAALPPSNSSSGAPR